MSAHIRINEICDYQGDNTECNSEIDEIVAYVGFHWIDKICPPMPGAPY
jgi:hypothetical protein